MQLFGLDPVHATIVISVLGVSLQVGLGVLQSRNPFDGKKLLASALIAVFAAFALVLPVIQTVPDNAGDLVMFGTFVGLIATIAGIDTMVKNAGKAAFQGRKK